MKGGFNLFAGHGCDLVLLCELPEHLLQVTLTLLSDRCCGVVFIADRAAYGIVSSLRTPKTYPRVTPRRGDFFHYFRSQNR